MFLDTLNSSLVNPDFHNMVVSEIQCLTRYKHFLTQHCDILWQQQQQQNGSKPALFQLPKGDPFDFNFNTVLWQ